ncbi:uncharacterized protein LOC129763623 [Toxorhynchites rutilus septentrionalis]|uniref:uncharacterized protein LOC129763623 n=1 Tax=Toxorhynchites rutilus septentrionalis TaxID=329112 RepID=UPI00247A6CB0|nr:uncharacterized protein LOC129763623 [Toxorhynchites rutilus septentrionalis]XP_055618840.1 uncharacterized protein LOC129763623 [Toxorhynchites rutilus septentrionalis]
MDKLKCFSTLPPFSYADVPLAERRSKWHVWKRGFEICLRASKVTDAIEKKDLLLAQGSGQATTEPSIPDNVEQSDDLPIDGPQKPEETANAEAAAVMQQSGSEDDSANRGRSQRTIRLPRRYNECFMKY